jgi:cytochrome c biogenesis protein CcmG/thiol:disulfide interchange protein DsbE
MSRQWLVVILIVGGLVAGAAALSRFGSAMEPVEVGARMPDYRLTDSRTGDSLALRAQYKGTVTLVNIWATWCLPCRFEMPSMQKVYEDLHPAGFRIAAVSIDVEPDDVVNAFTEKLGITFDILHDRSMRIQQVYQTTGVPESFLVNSDGIIVKRVIGAHDWSSPVNRALIERLLQEAGTAKGVAARQ